MTDSAGPAFARGRPRLGNGLKEQDRELVLRRLAGLDAWLRSFRADAVDLLEDQPRALTGDDDADTNQSVGAVRLR